MFSALPAVQLPTLRVYVDKILPLLLQRCVILIDAGSYWILRPDSGNSTIVSYLIYVVVHYIGQREFHLTKGVNRNPKILFVLLLILTD